MKGIRERCCRSVFFHGLKGILGSIDDVDRMVVGHMSFGCQSGDC